MGNSVKSFAVSVAKEAAKGLINHAGSFIPIIGGPIASYINSKFAKGSYDIGTVALAHVPDGAKTKLVSTPQQLKALIKQYPDQALKAGLTPEKVDQAVMEAKEEKASMAVGGKVKKALPKALDKWRSHLDDYRKKHPELSLKEAMMKAKDSYHK